jgi:hypothetical protein
MSLAERDLARTSGGAPERHAASSRMGAQNGQRTPNVSVVCRMVVELLRYSLDIMWPLSQPLNRVWIA